MLIVRFLCTNLFAAVFFGTPLVGFAAIVNIWGQQILFAEMGRFWLSCARNDRFKEYNFATTHTIFCGFTKKHAF